MLLSPILWNYPILVTAYWPCCLLPVFYHSVIGALLIFILKSSVKILRKLSPKMDLQGIPQETFLCSFSTLPIAFLLRQLLYPTHIVSFLILIFFSLTGSFPMRRSIKCFIKLRIDEIYWISFIRKYPIKKSYCTSLVQPTFANLLHFILFSVIFMSSISHFFKICFKLVKITFPSSLSCQH